MDVRERWGGGLGTGLFAGEEQDGFGWLFIRAVGHDRFCCFLFSGWCGVCRVSVC